MCKILVLFTQTDKSESMETKKKTEHWNKLPNFEGTCQLSVP